MVGLLEVIQLEDTEIIATKYVRLLQKLYISFSGGDFFINQRNVMKLKNCIDP
jgi:hypothetical protein